MKIKLKPVKKRPLISSSSSSSIITNLMINNNNNTQNHNQVDDTNHSSKKSESNMSEITDNSTSKLRINLPWATSSRFGNVSSPTNHHDYDFPPDFARASAEFYTPTYQAMKNSAFFSNRQREKSKRLSNASTSYESTIGNEIGHQNLQRSTIYGYESSTTLFDGFDPEVLGLLPPVPEDFSNATPVDCEINPRPNKPFQEFLDEVQSQKERAEIGASRKENYTNLLRKLRIKEDAIEAWESKQKSKVEDQLDKLERGLERKRAKAVQRTHKRLIETEMEAEKRKAIARRSVLKEMSKLQIIT